MALFGRKKAQPGAGEKAAGATSTADAAANGPIDPSDVDKAKARKWFDHAQTVADTRNYDYAIECYTNGLELWPEAVEEGHMKLRLVATQRHAAGKKTPSAGERMKRPVGRKDALRNMLNAEFLWAKDPTNITYMEALFKNAVKAQCDATGMWFGPIVFEAAANEKKPSAQRFLMLREGYLELAERFREQDVYEESCEAFERAIKALSLACRMRPEDSVLADELRAISTQLTIVRGRFDRAASFTDSVRDKKAQADIHDVTRLVQSDDRIAELIADARREMAAHPGVPTKIKALTDLLSKRENDRDEAEAIEILEKAYTDTDRRNHRFKVEADNLRMRQFRRARRAMQARLEVSPTDVELRRDAKAMAIRHAQAELEIFEARAKAYPTDRRIAFEYGKRLFQSRKLDEAIPVLQEARADAKKRTECSLYIGRCFYEKKYGRQAVDVLTEAVAAYEIQGDSTSKGLRYWLARSLELEARKEEAMKCYGQLLQMDYNYRDVRKRMDELTSKPS